MAAPPDRHDVALRWLRWAEEDLEVARHIAAGTSLVPRGACAWAQQAAEKAIKALLVDRDVDPPKHHDLDRLTDRLPDDDRIDLMAIDLPELTRWAIEGRYPDDLDEATTADALRAIALSERVLDLAIRELRRTAG
jgi:HEPN domain-containing protein